MYYVCVVYYLSLPLCIPHYLSVSFNVHCHPINLSVCLSVSLSLSPPLPLSPQAWAYMLGGLIIYAIERTVRFFRSLRKVVIVKVVEHPSKTIEIQMRSKGFFADAGQYVFVNVPSAALFEWHPFTLTSVSFT